MNVCIGGDFEGNDVYYEGVRDNPHKKHVTLTNRIGFGVFHPGQNAHGATKISKGKVCVYFFDFYVTYAKNHMKKRFTPKFGVLVQESKLSRLTRGAVLSLL